MFWKLLEIKPTQDEVAANPSCVNGCIYQEVGNPSSYACFVDAYNEVGCSVDVQEQSKYFIFFSWGVFEGCATSDAWLLSAKPQPTLLSFIGSWTHFSKFEHIYLIQW